MASTSEGCQSFVHKLVSKEMRVGLMFILTISIAVIEIVYGIRTHSNSLIADGLYSFAEGICLIGVILILRNSKNERKLKKNNTFGYERSELLFGLIQEVFLLSVSLGIVVDAVNHIVNPLHVHHPELMIYLGGMGMIVGILGMAMFWGYHHNHDIEEEITEKKKKEFLAWTTKHTKKKRKTPNVSRQNTILETSGMVPVENKEIDSKLLNEDERSRIISLEGYTYENVELGESRIYATLHALCLHSFVVLLESLIVILSGLLIKYIPHYDPVTQKEINTWIKYIDPVLTLIMVVIIVVRAVPAIFSISEILIEDVPGGINTEVLMREIITSIPAIKSIHSLHIWRATAKDIYATLHLVCEDDVLISTCTNDYGRTIQKIMKTYCVQYFTLQFEHTSMVDAEHAPIYRCVHGLHRKRRGHTLDEPLTKLAKDAIVHIQ